MRRRAKPRGPVLPRCGLPERRFRHTMPAMRIVDPQTGPGLKIYANPVRRGRVAKAEDWEWSSARRFAAIGPVPIAMHAMVRVEFSREGPGQAERRAAVRSPRPSRPCSGRATLPAPLGLNATRRAMPLDLRF
jgi:hypothetical protein